MFQRSFSLVAIATYFIVIIDVVDASIHFNSFPVYAMVFSIPANTTIMKTFIDGCIEQLPQLFDEIYRTYIEELVFETDATLPGTISIESSEMETTEEEVVGLGISPSDIAEIEESVQAMETTTSNNKDKNNSNSLSEECKELCTTSPGAFMVLGLECGLCEMDANNNNNHHHHYHKNRENRYHRTLRFFNNHNIKTQHYNPLYDTPGSAVNIIPGQGSETADAYYYLVRSDTFSGYCAEQLYSATYQIFNV